MLGLDLTEEPRAIREAKEEGERSLIFRQLTKKVGQLDEAMRSQVATLSSEQLEQLGEALLDFATVQDLKTWFSQQD